MHRFATFMPRVLILLALTGVLAACGGGAGAPATTKTTTGGETPAAKAATSGQTPATTAATSPEAKPASQAQSGETIKWTLADIVSVGHPAYGVVDGFVKEVDEKSGGRLQITHGTAGELNCDMRHWGRGTGDASLAVHD